MSSAESVPVITVDGPSGSGKGTVALAVARSLGWNFLDSGALYRVVGLLSLRHPSKPAAELARGVELHFEQAADGTPQVWLGDEDVSAAIRSESVSQAASKVAADPRVRSALVQAQRDFCRFPGLVADGRDMGTVIFSDAGVKVFLTASVEERARRRHKQLIGKGQSANLGDLLRDIGERDRRDRERSAAPLRPADDALMIDSTALDVPTVVQQILSQRALVATG